MGFIIFTHSGTCQMFQWAFMIYTWMSIKVLWVNKIFSSLFPENFLLLLSLINRLENPHIFYLIYINSDNNKRIHLLCVHAKSIQLCLALCCPVDSSPPGSSVHGILKARILEWVDMPSSKGSSRPRDLTRVSYVFCIGRQILYH